MKGNLIERSKVFVQLSKALILSQIIWRTQGFVSSYNLTIEYVATKENKAKLLQLSIRRSKEKSKLSLVNSSLGNQQNSTLCN